MELMLKDLVQVSCGDKGNDSDINIFAPDKETYDLLKKQLTASKVKDHFGEIVEGDVIRYEIFNVLALKFHLKEALGGGGSSSLRMDNLGKTLGPALLRFKVEVPINMKNYSEGE